MSHNISSFHSMDHLHWIGLLLTSLSLPLLVACSSQPSENNRSAPGNDSNCQQSMTSPSNTDHRYLGSISMQNATTGWGLNYIQKGNPTFGVPTAEPAIVHTTDGGCHWKIVKSWTYSMEPSPDFYPFFISPTKALIYVNGDLFLTQDSGASWHASALRGAKEQKIIPQHVFFLNEQLGWMLASRTSKGIDILQSSDSGQSWTPLQTSLPNLLTDDAVPTSLSFLNATTGWLVGTKRGSAHQLEEKIWILQTRDGGKSWQQQHLSTPQGSSTSPLTMLGQPSFFTELDGILPASTEFSNPGAITNFITHDGGQSWQSQPLFSISDGQFNPERGGGPRILNFTSLSTGWARFLARNSEDTSFSLVLYQTTNSGRTWHAFPHALPIRPSDPGFQFVTDSVAFALARTGFSDDFQNPSELYRTTDGGKTWTTLRYTIS